MTILVEDINSKTGITIDGLPVQRKRIDLDRQCSACGYTIYGVQSEWVVGREPDLKFFHDSPRCITLLIKEPS